MRILVCGPESSGTKMMTDLFLRASDGFDVTVTHRSFPYGGGPRPSVVEFPEVSTDDFDVAIVVCRDWSAMQKSQIAVGHSEGVYLNRWIREAYARIFDLVAEKPFYVLPYESVVLHPECLLEIFEELGLTPFVPEIGDANAKYYGGEDFHDHRPVEARRA